MTYGTLGLWLLLILWTFIIFCIYSFRYKKYGNLSFGLSLGIISYLLLQIICRHDRETVSFGVILMVCLAETVILCFFIRREYHWVQTHFSEMTVKHAVDALPTGICCYDANGRVLLKNKRMEELHWQLTGKALVNGCTFESFLYSEKQADREKLDHRENRVMIFPDQRVFEFRKEGLQGQTGRSSKSVEYVITAAEITEEYQKTQTLLEKQQIVTELNQRLRTYNKEILSVITAKEVLNAKVKIHDELGASLLRVKKYLSNQRNQEESQEEKYKREWEKEEILESLKANLTFLQHELGQNEEDEYALLLKTAKQLDVKIEIEGMLPTDETNRNLCVTALHESLTNTLRHAQGNLLKVTFNEDVEYVTAVYTNNGMIPSGEIVEKGGLKTLRRLVEQEGGRMEIGIKDAFVLTIVLRKRGRLYGI